MVLLAHLGQKRCGVAQGSLYSPQCFGRSFSTGIGTVGALSSPLPRTGIRAASELLHLDQELPLDQTPARSHERHPSYHQHHPSEDLKSGKGSVIASQQRTADRVSAQRRDADDGEQSARAEAYLPDIADLRDASGCHADKSTGRKAVKGREDNDRRVGARWQPKRQDEDTGEEGGDDQDIEAAEAVPQPARDGSPKYGSRVEDGQKVGGEIQGHAF